VCERDGSRERGFPGSVGEHTRISYRLGCLAIASWQSHHTTRTYYVFFFGRRRDSLSEKTQEIWLSLTLSVLTSEFGHDVAGNLYYANMIKCD
jgi:hypothetical protein